ncbi:O-antigen ligase family protein [Halosegnis longus]
MAQGLHQIGSDLFSWQVIYLLVLSPQLLQYVELPGYYLFIFMLAILICIQLHPPRKITISNSFVKMIIVYSAFILYSSVSLLWAPSVGHSSIILLDMTTICLLLIAAPGLLIESNAEFHKLMRIIIYASFLVGIVIIFGFISDNYRRPFQIVGAASHIGPGRIIGIGIPIAGFYVSYANRAYQRLSSLVVLLFLMLAIGISESRGPLVASITSLAFILFIYPLINCEDTNTVKYAASLIISLIISGYLLAINSLPTLDRVLQVFRGTADSSFQQRVEFYNIAGQMWMESPLIGHGLGSFHAEVGVYPHNFIFEIASGLGLIGLSLFTAILYIVVKQILSTDNSQISALLFGLLIYAIINASISHDLPGQRHLFFVLGLSTCLFVVSDSKN